MRDARVALSIRRFQRSPRRAAKKRLERLLDYSTTRQEQSTARYVRVDSSIRRPSPSVTRLALPTLDVKTIEPSNRLIDKCIRHHGVCVSISRLDAPMLQ